MNSKNILKAVGNKIRIIRQSKGLSQEKLAFRANLHRTYIGGIERGERNVSIVNIFKIAKALNISPKILLDISEDL